MTRIFSRRPAAAVLLAAWILTSAAVHAQQPVQVLHKTVKVGDLDIFYREAGPKGAPTILLLHGFPTSSQMFRNLIPLLADKYHVVAPDYPGFGHSSMPSRDKFTYTFDNVAKAIDDFTQKIGLTKYAIYVQDYGAPVGYRLASAHPERITAIIAQNGNAYEEGIDNKFWTDLKAYWKDPTSLDNGTAAGAVQAAHLAQRTLFQYMDGSEEPRPDPVPTARPTISSCSTARGTMRSSLTCSSATAATRRSIRAGRSTSASTNRRR